MSSSEDDIPLAARTKTKPPLLIDKGMCPPSSPALSGLMVLEADIPVKERISTNHVISKRVDDLVNREVDAAGTPKPHPKSLVNKVVNSDNLVPKKKRIVISDDDSDDDIPLVLTLGSHKLTGG